MDSRQTLKKKKKWTPDRRCTHPQPASPTSCVVGSAATTMALVAPAKHNQGWLYSFKGRWTSKEIRARSANFYIKITVYTIDNKNYYLRPKKISF